MGADSDIGGGTLLVEKRNSSPVEPDASEATEVVVPTDIFFESRIATSYSDRSAGTL
jgi:hypothetical protein